MLDKIKSGLAYICCAFLGIFHFVMLFVNSISIVIKSEDHKNITPLFNGYQTLGFGQSEQLEDFYDEMEWINDVGSFDGLRIFGAVLQILLLIIALSLLAFGVIGILKAFGAVDFLPDKLGSMRTSMLAKIGLLAYVGLTLTLVIMLGSWCLVNTYFEDDISFGLSLGGGPWLALIRSALVAATAFLLPVFVPELKETDGPCVNYVCTQCGKKASKNEKFCNACGGAIVAVEVKPMEYVCGNCGKKAKKTDKFCNACGGAVIARAVVPAAPVAVPMAAPAARVCPVCGKTVAAEQKFCSGCGSIL